MEIADWLRTHPLICSSSMNTEDLCPSFRLDHVRLGHVRAADQGLARVFVSHDEVVEFTTTDSGTCNKIKAEITAAGLVYPRGPVEPTREFSELHARKPLNRALLQASARATAAIGAQSIARGMMVTA